MKTAILFDLDGTLLDTLQDLADSVNATLRHFGYPERSLEEIRTFVGNGAKWLIFRSVPEGADPEEAFRFFREYYGQHCRIKTKPYTGIPEALERIGKNFPVAIVSNKPDSAVKELCAEWFPGIYALGELSHIPRKPEPHMVQHAMQHLGVQSCIYVGDSEVDVLTARNAGVPCLSVLWGFRNRKELETAGGTCFCENPFLLEEKIKEMIYGK